MQQRVFSCNICDGRQVGHIAERGDGKQVLFCADCDMGVVENPPVSTDFFYADGYYQGDDSGGYVDYELTAEHSLLWVRLLIEAVFPGPSRFLDVGCADGFLLDRLRGPYEKFGIEVNEAAIAAAKGKGITIVGQDIFANTISRDTVGRFDVITSIATFEHVLDFKAAMQKCLDLLVDEGLLIFEVPLISRADDNSGWYNGSYEHIFYPTVQGIERLFSNFAGINSFGFESKIKGFGATYIGVLAWNKALFEKVTALVRAMQREDPSPLEPTERRLNIAYTLVHDFNPTPQRIKELPDLIEATGGSPKLIKHMCNLWLADNHKASAADWHKQQATNWENAQKETADAAAWHRQQAQNWEEAYKKIAKRS